MDSFWVLFCWKIALFSHFSAGSDIRTNFIQYLNFGEIQISSKKKYIKSTTGSSELETFSSISTTKQQL